MALPPGFLDELRARVPVSQIVGRRVAWDSRKSNPARGDFWACCPFHDEKSPSFHADDRRGYYHCFGCGAKGDAVTFLREKEGLSFMEAVAELAREAGMAMPAQDPAAAARAERARGLADWMEEAMRFFRRRLAGPEGQAARRYLAGRGLSEATVERFELGLAPGGRRALCEHLTSLGARVEALVEAGLVGVPEDGGAPYDRFRDRLMFPIRDPRGRCIAFGARALREGQEPKYLNSPETPLFDKSRTLFNLGPARAAAARSGRLVVVEGYVDVIALAQAGLEEAVAPLGTALTEAQFDLLWRVCPEPLLALDGDAAGARAAHRAIDLALPKLAAGRSLRVALLPQGQDPDDLVRQGGREAVEAALAAAEAPVALLWRRETEGRVFDSPERRAALDARLKELLGRITDPVLRSHYRADLAERRAGLLGQRQPLRGDQRVFRPGRAAALPVTAPLPGTRRSALAREAQGSAMARRREAAILLTCLYHPLLLERHADRLAEIELTQPDLDAMRGAFLSQVFDQSDVPAAMAEWRQSRDGQAAMAVLQTALHGTLPLSLRAGGTEQDAEAALLEALDRHSALVILGRETEEAAAALCGSGDPEPAVDRRLSAARETAERLMSQGLPEADHDEAGLAAALQDAINRQIWVKRKRR